MTYTDNKTENTKMPDLPTLCHLRENLIKVFHMSDHPHFYEFDLQISKF